MIETPLLDPRPSSASSSSLPHYSSIHTDLMISGTQPLFIGVGGGSSSGKKRVCTLIMESLLERGVQGKVMIIR